MSKQTKAAKRAVAERIAELAPKATPHEVHQLAQAWRELTYGATGGRGFTETKNDSLTRYEDGRPPKGTGFTG